MDDNEKNANNPWQGWWPGYGAGPGAPPPPGAPFPGAAGPGPGMPPPYWPGYGHPYHHYYGHPGYPPPPAPGPAGGGLLAGLGSDAFLKGLLIGAGASLLLSNETVQKTTIATLVKLWSGMQGSVEELKERFRDIEAELQAASDDEA